MTLIPQDAKILLSPYLCTILVTKDQVLQEGEIVYASQQPILDA